MKRCCRHLFALYFMAYTNSLYDRPFLKKLIKFHLSFIKTERYIGPICTEIELQEISSAQPIPNFIEIR
jgi:hypothetical protein